MNINDNVCISIPGRGLVEVTIVGTNGNYHTCEEDNKMQHIVHKDDIYTPAQGRDTNRCLDHNQPKPCIDCIRNIATNMTL